MAVTPTIQQNLPVAAWALNPIWFRVSLAITSPDDELGINTMRFVYNGIELQSMLDSNNETYINIAPLFDLSPSLPQASEMVAGVGINTQVCTDSFEIYGITYGYIVAGVYEQLGEITDRTALYGGPALGSTKLLNQSSTASILHTPGLRIATKAMPHWIYFWDRYDGENTNTYYIRARVTYTDGTQNTYLLSTLNNAASRLLRIAAGWVQLGLQGIAATPDDVIAYDILFTDELSETVFFMHSILLSHYEHEWLRYILADNGLGGLETLLFAGPMTTNQERLGSGDPFRIARTPFTDIKTGDLLAAHSESGRDFSIQTGGISEDQAQRYSQLLTGKVAWFIEGSTFRKIICTLNDIQVLDDEQSLYNLTFTFQDATINRTAVL